MHFQGEKSVLKTIGTQDPDLLKGLETASGGGSLDERIAALRQAIDKVFEPLGGAWQPGEMLFFAEQGNGPEATDEWEDFVASLTQPSAC